MKKSLLPFFAAYMVVPTLHLAAQDSIPVDLLYLKQEVRSSQPEFRQTIKKSGHLTGSEWQELIDDRWGSGLPTEEKLVIFDEFWRRIDEEYACFPNSDIDWDALRDKYRSEVEAGVSRGRFDAIINHMALALQEIHVQALDYNVAADLLEPGVPLMTVNGMYRNSHFGAALTPMADSTLLVYKAMEHHPLGLEPGDRVIGYDRRPWKVLYRELLSYELPLSWYPVYGSTPESALHSLLVSAGENWHLFDSIDIVRYRRDDTLHLPVSLMKGMETVLHGTEQMPVSGVSFPDLENGNCISWGKIDGTNVGYIYTWALSTDYMARSLISAIGDLDHDTDGLIIDTRFNNGGNYSPARALSQIYNYNFYTVGTDKRTDPDDHFGFSTVTASNLPYETWPVWSEADAIKGSPNLYDRPIAILTGPASGSYGDIFPVMVRFHPYARTFGKPTAGSFSGLDGSAKVQLEKGWVMQFPNYNCYLVSDPQNYLTHTAPPVDEEVWLDPDDVAKGEDTVVKRALEWIRNRVYPYRALRPPEKCYPMGSLVPAMVHLHNPNSHPVELWSYLFCPATGTNVDSTLLAVSDSDLYNGFLTVPGGEEDLSMTFRSIDLEDGKVQVLPKINPFITRGPVGVDHVAITPSDGVPLPGFVAGFRIFLKNGGSVKTIRNLKAVFTRTDTCIDVLGPVEQEIDYLEPGEVRELDQTLMLRIGTDCGIRSEIQMKVDLYEDNRLYWVDTFNVKSGRIASSVEPFGSPGFVLYRNYPNPFSGHTTIQYTLGSSGHVRLGVYDLTGREVRTLADEWLEAGGHAVDFDAAGLPEGVYVCRLTTGRIVLTRRMLLVR